MEKLTINIPDDKSMLVKQMLKDMGVSFQPESLVNKSLYREKLAKVSVWTAEDLEVFEETKKAFDNLKPQQW